MIFQNMDFLNIDFHDSAGMCLRFLLLSARDLTRNPKHAKQQSTTVLHLNPWGVLTSDGGHGAHHFNREAEKDIGHALWNTDIIKILKQAALRSYIHHQQKWTQQIICI